MKKLGIMLASIALFVMAVATVVSARGWVQQGGAWYYQNSDGDFVTETMQSSNNSKFYLGEDGAMVTDYFLEDYGDGNNCYYFGSNGAMVTNTWVAIDPSIVSNTGDYIPSVYWYYFGSTGKAIKASSESGGYKRTTIDGKKYAFNEYGQMLTGWIDPNGNILDEDNEDDPFNAAIFYAGGDNDGALRSGWLTYYDGSSTSLREGAFDDRSVLYFYFNPTNNVKIGMDRNGTPTDDGGVTDYKTKKVNGRTYAFDSGSGVMLAEWDAFKNDDKATPSNNTEYYFSAEDDGHLVKKGWIYAVPAEDINADDYNDDELRYMYFNNSGNIIKDQIKKISGKYYGFDDTGVMKTGLVMYSKNGKYVTKFNGDNTQGEEISKKGIFRTASNEEKSFTKNGQTGFVTYNGTDAKIHYFGSDGARRTGINTIEFADDNYSFGADNNGHYDGLKKKKYYSNGILLKASADLRYGMYISTPSCVEHNYEEESYETGIEVLNTAGSKVKGSFSSKKDADGNYWLIAKEKIDTNEGTINANELIGVWTVDVRWHALNVGNTTTGNANEKGLQFKADGWLNDDNNEQSNRWINGDNSCLTTAPSNEHQEDTTGRWVTLSKRGHGEGGSYAVIPSNDAALNFTWAD